MADDEMAEETLDVWALRYRGLATFGALALLLGSGKFLGFHWEKLPFLRRVEVPSAVVSGVMGCFVYRLSKGIMSPGVKHSIDEGLSEVGFVRLLCRRVVVIDTILPCLSLFPLFRSVCGR